MSRNTLIALSVIIVSAVVFTVVGRTLTRNSTRSAARANFENIDASESGATAGADVPADTRDVFISAKSARQAPAFVENVPWINSAPLTLEGLRGRVVLVDFWTFGCYNCRNTLPTLKRFDASYRERGLTIVGVQTPEFDSEKQVETVRGQVRTLGIKYPVVMDNDYVTWRAYGVEAWPTVVILDKQGRIRYTHIGEGAYDAQEKIIKTLLAESEKQGADASQGAYRGEKIVKTEAEWRALLTAEQYRVMRDKGTERAFTGEYNDQHESGTYHCAACNLTLFNSKAKFESGTGWPSFFQPIAAANVTEEVDSMFGIRRTEVLCSRCGAHLGHVFDDGPKPTGLRYCMNSVSLKFNKQS
ncbi:MAG TPA: peptide-methionine (R)-S-oxide reductase MsrB [Pyrinomonadaceae bacterium]